MAEEINARPDAFFRFVKFIDPPMPISASGRATSEINSPDETSIEGRVILKYENGRATTTASIKGFVIISFTVPFNLRSLSLRIGTVKITTASILYNGRIKARSSEALPNPALPNKFEIMAKPTIAKLLRYAP